MILTQTFLEISPSIWLHSTSCQLTLSLPDIFLKNALSPDDNSNESPDLGGSIDLLVTLIPELGSDFGVELDHGCISGDDGVESLFKLALMEGRLFVIVVILELLKYFAIIGLCHTH